MLVAAQEFTQMAEVAPTVPSNQARAEAEAEAKERFGQDQTPEEEETTNEAKKNTLPQADSGSIEHFKEVVAEGNELFGADKMQEDKVATTTAKASKKETSTQVEVAAPDEAEAKKKVVACEMREEEEIIEIAKMFDTQAQTLGAIMGEKRFMIEASAANQARAETKVKQTILVDQMRDDEKKTEGSETDARTETDANAYKKQIKQVADAHRKGNMAADQMLEENKANETDTNPGAVITAHEGVKSAIAERRKLTVTAAPNQDQMPAEIKVVEGAEKEAHTETEATAYEKVRLEADTKWKGNITADQMLEENKATEREANFGATTGDEGAKSAIAEQHTHLVTITGDQDQRQADNEATQGAEKEVHTETEANNAYEKVRLEVDTQWKGNITADQMIKEKGSTEKDTNFGAATAHQAAKSAMAEQETHLVTVTGDQDQMQAEIEAIQGCEKEASTETEADAYKKFGLEADTQWKGNITADNTQAGKRVTEKDANPGATTGDEGAKSDIAIEWTQTVTNTTGDQNQMQAEIEVIEGCENEAHTEAETNTNEIVRLEADTQWKGNIPAEPMQQEMGATEKDANPDASLSDEKDTVTFEQKDEGAKLLVVPQECPQMAEEAPTVPSNQARAEADAKESFGEDQTPEEEAATNGAKQNTPPQAESGSSEHFTEADAQRKELFAADKMQEEMVATNASAKAKKETSRQVEVAALDEGEVKEKVIVCEMREEGLIERAKLFDTQAQTLGAIMGKQRIVIEASTANQARAETEVKDTILVDQMREDGEKTDGSEMKAHTEALVDNAQDIATASIERSKLAKSRTQMKCTVTNQARVVDAEAKEIIYIDKTQREKQVAENEADVTELIREEIFAPDQRRGEKKWEEVQTKESQLQAGTVLVDHTKTELKAKPRLSTEQIREDKEEIDTPQEGSQDQTDADMAEQASMAQIEMKERIAVNQIAEKEEVAELPEKDADAMKHQGGVETHGKGNLVTENNGEETFDTEAAEKATMTCLCTPERTVKLTLTEAKLVAGEKATEGCEMNFKMITRKSNNESTTKGCKNCLGCCEDPTRDLEVEKIHDHRRMHGRRELFLKWKGDRTPTWVAHADLHGKAMTKARQFLLDEKHKEQEQNSLIALSPHGKTKPDRVVNNNVQKGKIVYQESSKDETYYEIEDVIDFRTVDGGRTKEYLLKWKGVTKCTWEPDSSLCKKSKRDAYNLVRRRQYQEEKAQKSYDTSRQTTNTCKSKENLKNSSTASRQIINTGKRKLFPKCGKTKKDPVVNTNIQEGKIVYQESSHVETYYEIEDVIDFRVMDGSRIFEYLLKWKGETKCTWEPWASLCEKSKRDAYNLRRQRHQLEKAQKSCNVSRHTTQKEKSMENLKKCSVASRQITHAMKSPPKCGKKKPDPVDDTIIKKGKIAYQEPSHDETYFEIEDVIDARTVEGSRSYEYLLKWKGETKCTWEPWASLCEKSKKDAKSLVQRQRREKAQKSCNVSGQTTKKGKSKEDLKNSLAASRQIIHTGKRKSPPKCGKTKADPAVDTNVQKGKIIYQESSNDETYYEIEDVVDFRTVHGSGTTYEYLLKWKGVTKCTWEPDTSLCEKSKRDAYNLRRRRQYHEENAQKSDASQHTIKKGKSKENLKKSSGASRQIMHTGKRKSTPSHGVTFEQGGKRSKTGETSLIKLNPKTPFETGNKVLDVNGGIPIEIIMSSEDITGKMSPSFLSTWAKGREISCVYNISGDMTNYSPKKEFPFKGRTYTLFSKKVDTESGNGGKFGWASKCIVKLIYIATKGIGLQEWNLQEELEKIADFQALKPEKAVARLELFLTPCLPDCVWDRLTADNFEMIKQEDSHEGCGFIPEEFLEELLPNKYKTRGVGSIQIRGFGPLVGVLKGMLVKKRGISKIQLPPSMRKVAPSRSNKKNWVVLLVKVVCPSESNLNLGRYTDPEKTNPCASFMKRPAKPLSDMYVNIMIGLGLPPSAVNSYKTRAKRIQGLKHAHVRGVIDPTDSLTPGSVFITGFNKDEAGNRQTFSKGFDKLFITRSPCVEPSDVKMLPVISTKPKKMSKSDWDWLCSFPFGHIIFSKPKDGIPLPIIVGEGDLDGDDYFVCWDDNIIGHMKSKAIATRMNAEEKSQRQSIIRRGIDKVISGPPPRGKGSSTWLDDAQNMMLHLSRFKNASRLTGKLYSLCIKTSKESEKRIYDKDSRSFGRAFKDSLDVAKHGGQVNLPSHLREHFSEALIDSICWK